MASTTVYMTTMMNMMNDVKRENITEVMNTLKSKDLLTEEIQTVLNEMLSSVKTNKKVKKEKKPRFSGYHLFMKEHRAVVKAEQPDIKPQELTTIVSKAWKDIAEDKKEEFNARALKMKEEYINSNNNTDNEENKEEEVVEKKEVTKKSTTKKATEKKPAKKATEKKPATKKKIEKPETPVTSDDEDVNIQINETDSDIELDD